MPATETLSQADPWLSVTSISGWQSRFNRREIGVFSDASEIRCWNVTFEKELSVSLITPWHSNYHYTLFMPCSVFASRPEKYRAHCFSLGANSDIASWKYF